MTRDEKIAEARRRCADGESPYVIGPDLGVSKSAIYQWVYPERYAESRPSRARQKRVWENAHDRELCPCGTPMGVGAKRRGFKLCRPCRDEVIAVERAMREERIAGLWIEGRTLKQIAAALDSSPSSITGAMAKMRVNGWDLPYRNNWTPEGLERARAARRAA